MFGKREWFEVKAIGGGLRPVVWQGWAYALAWIGVVAVPFSALVLRQQPLDACIWMVAAMGLLTWDVRSLRQSLLASEPGESVLYIDDDGGCETLR